MLKQNKLNLLLSLCKNIFPFLVALMKGFAEAAIEIIT